ncbi:MAG: efflux RND transporter periplasmic adaptor subunit [Rubripirellula sp.]
MVESNDAKTKNAQAAGPDSGPREPIESARAQMRVLAAAIEIQCELDRHLDSTEAADVVTRLVARHLGVDQVWLLWRPTAKTSAFRTSHHQPTTANDAVEVKLMLDSVAEEVGVRGGTAKWPSSDISQRHATLTLKQLAKRISSAGVTAVSLQDTDGIARGALVVAAATDETVDQFLDTVGPLIAGKLSAIERLAPTRVQQWVGAISSSANRSRRRMGWAVAVIACIVLLLPFSYRVSVELELQPVQRRFVAVGFDGVLETANVRPGDQVRSGELLATIDSREIDFQLAGVQAELHQANQERMGLMVEHDFAGSKIAALEVDRLQLQKDLLEFRRGNLEIRSPIDGVVVSGDWKESEGIPMKRGETLFEIAPLGKMRVELAIPEIDYSMVREEMPVHFYVHALPGKAFAGKIDSVHPRSELRDQQNVFVGEVTVEDLDHLLRPGMKGRAAITSTRHTLAWNLFHKAYYSVRHAMRL